VSIEMARKITQPTEPKNPSLVIERKQRLE
jgi:hypothetical protein